MFTNRFAGRCASCNSKVNPQAGFAFKGDSGWKTACRSAACHRALGLGGGTSSASAASARTLSADGMLRMPYDPAALPLLRALPGARWDATYKAWRVSVALADLPRVLELCERLQIEVAAELRAAAPAALAVAAPALTRADAPRADGRVLFPFQRDGVAFLARHDRALLADDMGLGKTVQALVALAEGERGIIVCPAAVKYNWRDEAQRWRPDYRVTVLSGKGGFRLPEAGEIVVVNYDILPAWLAPVEADGAQGKKGKNRKTAAALTDEQRAVLAEVTVVADEAHLAKNFRTARSKRLAELCRAAKRAWLLTGTPLMNRPADLFGVLSAGGMAPLGHWGSFVRLFNGYKNRFGGYVFGQPDASVPERLRSVMLRRLKREVLTDLPPKTYQDLPVNGLDEELASMLDALAINLADGEGGFNVDLLPDFKQFSELRARLAASRIPSLLEHVASYEESDVPLLVFSAHRAPVLALKDREGWAVILGDTPAEERRNIVARFQAGELRGVALTIQAGGVGLTLTRASHALFVDLDWTPAANLQAEDRICRIGQTARSVLIQRMVSDHPLDRHVHKLLAEKIAIAHAALDAQVAAAPNAAAVDLVDETDEQLAARLAAIEEAGKAADREVARRRIRSIAEREAAKVRHVPEPALSDERKRLIEIALDAMACRCDGARTQDEVGFSKPDAGIGRWFAVAGLREDQDYRTAERILVRYRRQLTGIADGIWA